MNWSAISFDWNQIRAFLATAEEGSLSGAARVLGLSQPTLGRQVSALEKALDVALFERSGRSLIVTPTGLELLEHVRQMGEAATQISLIASGQSQRIEGRVRISASEWIATHLLPPVVTRLRETAPGIIIDIVATNSISDLRRREADIAIRHVEPTEPEFYARKLHVGGGGFYASRDFIARHGPIDAPKDLSALPFVGMDDPRLIEFLRDQGVEVSAENFSVLAENGLVQWALIRQGLGVGVMMDAMADQYPDVVRILPELGMTEIPTWLTTHRELQTSRRIRLVFDALIAAFG